MLITSVFSKDYITESPTRKTEGRIKTVESKQIDLNLVTIYLKTVFLQGYECKCYFFDLTVLRQNIQTKNTLGANRLGQV